MQQITLRDLGSSRMKSASGGESESSQQELPTPAQPGARSPERLNGQGQLGHASPQAVPDLLVGFLLSREQLWLQKRAQVLAVPLFYSPHLTKNAA